MKYDNNYRGLSTTEAAILTAKFGLNKLREKKGKDPLELFLEQFSSVLILILILAASVSFFLGEVIDSIAIIAIVFLNAVLGFVQEYRAEKSLDALRKIISPTAKVVRDGRETVIPAADIVPGDLVIIEAGDKVPSDGIIVESFSLHADESSLTGESLPVEKNVDLDKDESVPVPERVNRVFMGTAVTYGRAKFVVEKTGMGTEIGKIAEVIQEQKLSKTPLQKKLDVFGKEMAKVIFIIIAVVFVLGVNKGVDSFNMFLASVSLAVAAIPEGLPAVVTTSLALGVYRMSKKNAIVRKLPAVETLGATTVIVTDKTGTLTENQMTVKKIYTPSKFYEVSGSGYNVDGVFMVDGKEADVDEDLKMLLKAGVICNNSSFSIENGMPKVVGDPTEVSMLVAGAKAGLYKESLNEIYNRKYEVVFDSDRKRMSVVNSTKKDSIVCTKGAVDVMLKLCSNELVRGKEMKLSEGRKSEILKINESMASEALRIIAVAYKNYGEKNYDKDKIESGLVFLGLVGMIDPPRKEVKESIEICKKAGIKTVMITGDHKITAIAIANELNFPEGRVITGSELDGLSSEEFDKIVGDTYVYARMSPQHKTRIVKALQDMGEVVAMTGDGVNDAPALRLADIGVSMGITGTDVSKEASTMVLTDDNFATIVSAVKEGRGIYDNIRKFVFYLLSCNIGEVLTVFFAILLGSTIMKELPLPLVAVQILWMNLLTDGLPALALGMQPVEKDIMERKPRNMKEEIINRKTIYDIIFVGFLISIGTLYVFLGHLPDVAKAQSAAFTTIVFFQLFQAINSQSNKSVLKIIDANKHLAFAISISFLLQLVVLYVPAANSIFGTVPLTIDELIQTIAVSFLILPAVELRKIIFNRPVKDVDNL
ncbi:MAG: calcium-translocating P-type ATPase, SERCA-type [Candidatus Aenigmarchaeota archaeon]|nr:calcium-translocating P-type ATPase, SERCA-type [Candidatus Aenigmarchaeota archaeon]